MKTAKFTIALSLLLTLSLTSCGKEEISPPISVSSEQAAAEQAAAEQVAAEQAAAEQAAAEQAAAEQAAAEQAAAEQATTNDPQFPSCAAAKKAGYGNYSSSDPEYAWYEDRDGDGMVCEK